MKKFLPALLFIADLYGMISCDSIKTENSLESQVSKMYQQFKQFEQGAFNAASELCRLAGPYRQQELRNEYREQRSGALKILFKELQGISRFPNAEEKAILLKFRAAVNLPNHINFRIIDAESYISGLYLSEKDKSFFLGWLHATDRTNDEKLFDQYLSKVDFPNQFMNESNEISRIDGRRGQNEAFRQKIFNIITAPSRTSETYRKLMICFFANKESVQPVCSRYAYGTCSNAIFEGTDSNWSQNGISFCSDKSIEYTFFSGSQTRPMHPKVSVFSGIPEQTFFHECGHSIDFFSQAFYKLGANETIEVAAEFFNSSADKEEFKKIKPVMKRKMEKGNKSHTLDELRKTYSMDFSRIDDYLNYVEENLDDPIFQAKVLMQSPNEVWQILGFSGFSNDELKVDSISNLVNSNIIRIDCSFEKEGDTHDIYINLMSDGGLSLSWGRVLRFAHFYANLLQRFFHFRFPLEVYGAFMELHGTSLSAYLLKLQYPYGLSSLLKNEYRLMYGANSGTDN